MVEEPQERSNEVIKKDYPARRLFANVLLDDLLCGETSQL